MNVTIADIGRRALQGQRLARPDLLTLAELSASHAPDLLYWAWRVRFDRFGNKVRLCSIIAGKLGGCSENCKWCAQSSVAALSAANEDCHGVAERSRASRSGNQPKYATVEQILQAAQGARDCHAAGIGIVNSGRRPSESELQTVIDAAGEITGKRGQVPFPPIPPGDLDNGARTEKVPDPFSLYVCASLGELTPDQAARLAAAGVQRYNHNLESSRRFYPNVVSSHAYDDRLRTLAVARTAGLRLCCGGLLGMGETWEDRIDLALTLRDEVRPEIVPLNFLHPLPGTPLGAAAPLAPMEILRIIAVFRLAMPDVDIKVAGGREANLRDLQSWIFHAGATSIITGDYLTTPGRGSQADLQMLADLGMEVSDLGFAK